MKTRIKENNKNIRNHNSKGERHGYNEIFNKK